MTNLRKPLLITALMLVLLVGTVLAIRFFSGQSSHEYEVTADEPTPDETEPDSPTAPTYNEEQPQTPTIEPLVIGDSINYYRIWSRAAWYGGLNETNVFTALDNQTVASERVDIQDKNQIFRLIAVPDSTEWFYIKSVNQGMVLTAQNGTVILSPPTTNNQNQHWRLVYTAESVSYYERGAVTFGVYRLIENRATGTYIAHGNPLRLSDVDHLPISNPPTRNQNPAPHNPLPSTHWNIFPVDFEQMHRGQMPDTRTRASWGEFAIITPQRTRLNAAGRIHLSWTNADSFSRDITGYRIYINGVFDAFIPQADSYVLTHNFYDVEVARHYIRVDAMANNLVVASSEIYYFITKKGLARSAVLRVPPTGQAWFYNWGQQPMAGAEHLEFIPMQWGSASANTIQGNIQTAIDRGFTSFMGFNEPDLREEADIAVEVVIDRWMDAFVPFRDEIRLLSPVTAWPNSHYMHSMLDGVNSRHPNGPHASIGEREGVINYVDIIAYHDYATWPTFANFRNNMLSTNNLWPNHPIWITELGSRAPSDNLWPNHPVYGRSLTDNVLYNGFVELMEFMTETYWIERFAWFTFRPFNHGSPVVNNVGTQYGGMRTTYDASTGQLWPLGVLFREHGNPEGYVLPPLVPIIDAANTWDIFLQESAAAISGVPAPVAGETAVSNITANDSLIGSVAWYPPPAGGIFAEGVVYTAVIRLAPAPSKSYKMGLVSQDFFTVEGALSVSNPTGGAIITAVFPRTEGDAEMFTVTFFNWDGSVIRTDSVAYGEFANPPVVERTGHLFMGWDVSNFLHITSDITATAQFSQVHTVTFRNWDNAILETQAVIHGENATPPDVAARDAHSDFIGWDGEISNITGDIILTAQFAVSEGYAAGDLAFRQPATGSSVNPHNVFATADRAVDGDLSMVDGTYQHASFWQAYGGANNLYHYLTIDLGAVFDISRVEIEWGRSHLGGNPSDAMRHFEILLSDTPDGDWQVFATVSNPGVEDRLYAPLYNYVTPMPGATTSGRYIRIQVTDIEEVYTQWPRIAAFKVFE